jgi:hypothetical protein
MEINNDFWTVALDWTCSFFMENLANHNLSPSSFIRKPFLS